MKSWYDYMNNDKQQFHNLKYLLGSIHFKMATRIRNLGLEDFELQKDLKEQVSPNLRQSEIAD